MSSNKITNLTTPTLAADAANRSYVDSGVATATAAGLSNPAFQQGTATSSAQFLYPAGGSPAAILTSGNYRVYVTPAGNVGIGPGHTTPSTTLDVAGATKISGNLDMSSSGKIINLVNPTDGQDAATKIYVDNGVANATAVGNNAQSAANNAQSTANTAVANMATSSSVSSAISTALGSSGAGYGENRPTVQRGDTDSAWQYLTFINDTDLPGDGSTKRALMRCDGNLYYKPSTNTLYAPTFSGSFIGNATTASTAVYCNAGQGGSGFYAGSHWRMYVHNTGNIIMGNNATTSSSYLTNNGGTNYQEDVTLVVKPLSTASQKRPYYRHTSAILATDGNGSGVYGTPGGAGYDQDVIYNYGNKLFGGLFVAFFEGAIQLDSICVGSDKRMKQNITEITDGTSSLQLLRRIKCSTFEYVDKIRHSPYKVHGFIAQDIKYVVPEAVQLVPDCLPNFYCNCLVEKYSIQDNDKTETFRVYIPVNDVKKLIFTGNHDKKTGIEYKTESGEPASDASGNQNFKVKLKDSSDNDVEVMTTQIIDDFSFLIKVPLNEKGINDKITGETYFLYGQMVDDFHKIDTEHIHNIATAALQEVDRQQQADKARIAELEAKVSEQQSLINDILERLNKVERA